MAKGTLLTGGIYVPGETPLLKSDVILPAEQALQQTMQQPIVEQPDLLASSFNNVKVKASKTLPAPQKQNIGPVASGEQYANMLGYNQGANTIKEQKDLGTQFYSDFGNWKIVKPVKVAKDKPSVVTLQDPNTKEIKTFELSGDLNARSLNPGNVGTTIGKIGIGASGTINDQFLKGLQKTVLSEKPRPVLLNKNGVLKEQPNSLKTYQQKTLKEFVQTYLPEYVKTQKGSLIQENKPIEQKGYYNRLKAEITMIDPKLGSKIPSWESTNKKAPILSDFLQNNPDRQRAFSKFLFRAEGGKLTRIREIK